MLNNYENMALLRCVETGDFEPVNVFEFTPRVTLGIDLLPGTRYHKKLTLQYAQQTDDYRAEAFGRQFVSRGPKLIKEEKEPKFKIDRHRPKKKR